MGIKGVGKGMVICWFLICFKMFRCINSPQKMLYNVLMNGRKQKMAAMTYTKPRFQVSNHSTTFVYLRQQVTFLIGENKVTFELIELGV